MAIEPTPHLTKAGRYLMYGAASIALLLVLGMMVQACARQPRVVVAERWTQGYETQQGYMEPDHGFLYYWLLTRALHREAAPTYHIYVPPPNYPQTFRPWHDDTPFRPRVAAPDPAPAPTRRTGGFSTTPVAEPRLDPPTRRDGGFSPAVTRPTRETGGFSAVPQKAAPADRTPATRTSGGFSSPKASPAPKAAPASPTRSSGGFSDKTKPKK